MKWVVYERIDAIARITLDRPRVRNAQSAALIEEVDACFAEAGADPSVRVVILAGAGDHFSSGHDLGTPDEQADPGSFFKLRGLEALHLRSRELFLDTALRWRDFHKPTIGQVQGYCIFGGYMLASAMDLIVAADDAQFLPGLTQFFTAPWDMSVRKAKEVLFQSRFIGAEEAYRLELVNVVTPKEELATSTLELAGTIARSDPLQLRLIKFAINQAQDAMGYRSAIRDAHSHHMLSRVEAYLAEDFGRGKKLVKPADAIGQALDKAK